MNQIGRLVLVGILLTTACEPAPLGPVDVDPSFDTEDCEDVEWCDPGDPDAGGSAPFDWEPFRGFIGTWHDTNLYEAPGDPNPGAPGVWLGSQVTPSVCTSIVAGSDIDSDGLRDSCEYSLARSFAPYLQFALGEPCAKGAPAWAARYSYFGVVKLAYMMSYYADCGTVHSHLGDSEIVTVNVAYNTQSQHWVFTKMFTSAHHGTLGHSSKTHTDPWQLTFPVRYLSFPMVWVAYKKHANYGSAGDCNSGIAGDYCTSHDQIRYRFPVDPNRNTGQSGLPPCLGSPDFPGPTECYTVDQPFRGWQSNTPGVTSYRVMLLESGFFGEWP